MMLQVPISLEAEAVLRQRADARGEELSAAAARILEDALRSPRVDELLAPFRSQVAESGATDEDLDALCEELREEVCQAQQALRKNGA